MATLRKLLLSQSSVYNNYYMWKVRSNIGRISSSKALHSFQQVHTLSGEICAAIPTLKLWNLWWSRMLSQVPKGFDKFYPDGKSGKRSENSSKKDGDNPENEKSSDSDTEKGKERIEKPKLRKKDEPSMKKGTANTPDDPLKKVFDFNFGSGGPGSKGFNEEQKQRMIIAGNY